jgi:hypothetical protein
LTTILPHEPIMEIQNDTPLSVATMLWEDLEGKPRLTVILKGTFAMTPGGPAAWAAEPLPIFPGDVPSGDDPATPARFETDMVPFKPRADVVLVGRAHAPRGQPRDTPLDVSLRVGPLAKTLRVFGDRTWSFPTKLSLSPEISGPKPFVTIDLVYKRAFGGIDSAASLYCAENLVGTGFIGKKARESIHERPLPNIEDPQDLIRSWDSRPRPAGFGFYGRGWRPRLQHVGTPHPDPVGPEERRRGIAADFSYDFFNGAHPDLQAQGYLQGNEPVELRNVSPDSLIEFRLPGVRPRVAVAKWTTPPQDWLEQQLREGRPAALTEAPTSAESVAMALDTLVLIPDERIFYLVFRGQCAIASLDSLEVARLAVALEKEEPRPVTKEERPRPGARKTRG